MSTIPLKQNRHETTIVGTDANSTTLRDLTTELASLTTTSDNSPATPTEGNIEIESMSHTPLSMASSNHSEEKRIKKRKLSFEATMLRQKKQRVDDSATVMPSTIGIVGASTEVSTAEIPLAPSVMDNEDEIKMSEAEEAEEKRIKKKNSHEASVNLGLGKSIIIIR
jgi:hypothetical protein